MRHQRPRELNELTGAVKRNPARYSNTVPPSDIALGRAPEHMTPEAVKCWNEIESYSLEGVLKGSDRFMLELASTVLANYRKDPEGTSASKINILIGVLSRLGMSPADRAKLDVTPPDEGDDFEVL